MYSNNNDKLCSEFFSLTYPDWWNVIVVGLLAKTTIVPTWTVQKILLVQQRGRRLEAVRRQPRITARIKVGHGLSRPVVERNIFHLGVIHVPVTQRYLSYVVKTCKNYRTFNNTAIISAAMCVVFNFHDLRNFG